MVQCCTAPPAHRWSQPSVDGARRLFAVESAELTVVPADGQAVWDRAVLAASAQLVGVTRQLLDVAVGYAKERKQFGRSIGSFQAIQHQLVDARLQLEFAAPVVYRAAWSLSVGDEDRSQHISIAKAMASDAAWQAARTALQVHGAIGYTFEYDLHLWMKRAFALARAWGDARFHREQVAATLLDFGDSDA
jgi:alkylation response protein AidB-like acyl-CoA dehydrogenase